jgi:hypothetical protein
VRRARRSLVLAVLSCLVLAGAWARQSRAGGPKLASLLPGSGDAPGWSRDGEPQEYPGQELYTYIDGGAEIYHEYGFRGVIVQDFESAAGKSVSMEIFEMADPGAAYGVFTFKRSGQGRSVPLGSGGQLEDYYLNFWKGRYVVTLTGFDESEATIAGLLALGRAVDTKIGETAEAPDLVAALASEGLKPGSVKYLRGLLGLNNVYPFYTARGLVFTAAVKGDYESGASLIVLDYGSAQARASAWADLRAALENTGRFKRTGGPEAAVPLFLDDKGRYAAFRETGAHLAVGLGADPSVAIAIAAQAR